MENNIDINPIEKKDEICKILDELSLNYTIHTENDSDKEYDYLNGKNICITVSNSNSEYPMYIDLEDYGEFTLSYYKWHSHYMNEEYDYKILCEDLIDILNNKKCVIIINSKEKWLSSELSKTRLDKNYDYSEKIEKLPKEFQKKLKEEKGNIELIYWDKKDNIIIDI